MKTGPLRTAFSARPWRATAYLLSYLVAGIVLFTIALVVVVGSYVLSIVVFGLPLLVGSALVVRGLAQVERARALLVGERIVGEYRPVTGHGLFAHIRTRWSDRATRRDTIYLILMYPVLLLLDVVALAVWLVALAGITLPLWYWSVPSTWDGYTDHGVMLGWLPDGPETTFSGPGFGVWVGDLPTALVAALAFVVPAIAAALLVTGAARLHVRVAGYLLGPYRDPLHEAKEVLRRPGPLPVG